MILKSVESTLLNLERLMCPFQKEVAFFNKHSILPLGHLNSILAWHPPLTDMRNPWFWQTQKTSHRKHFCTQGFCSLKKEMLRTVLASRKNHTILRVGFDQDGQPASFISHICISKTHQADFCPKGTILLCDMWDFSSVFWAVSKFVLPQLCLYRP